MMRMMLQELRQQQGPRLRHVQEQQPQWEQDSAGAAAAHTRAPQLHPGTADLVAAACEADDTEQRYDQGGRLVQLGSSSGLPRRLQQRVRVPIKASR
jgi:hypothetical protein